MELEKKIDNIFTERNILIILGVSLLLTTILDIYTAVTSPIFKIGESNPIYLTYGLIPLTILNFIVLAVLLFGVQKSLKLSVIFCFVLGSIFLCYGHVIGSQSNIAATKIYEKNPELVTKYLQTMTKEDKMTGYKSLVFDRLLYPYLIVIIAFAFTMMIFEQRKPKREKFIQEGIKLLMKGRDL